MNRQLNNHPNEEETRTSPEEEPPETNHVEVGKLIDSFEGSVLLAGLLIGLGSVICILLGTFFDPENTQIIIGMTASHVMFGRAAGMSFGYTLGLGHNLVVPINMLIETILVMLFYPLFVFSWRRLVIIPSLKNLMDRTREAAEKHEDKIRRYGILGLFIFVWFPFWMTGPLVGCIIGFLMGLRPWLNLSVVLSGTFMAICSYAILLKGLHDKVHAVSPYAPFVLLGIIILLFGGAHLLSGRKKKKP